MSKPVPIVYPVRNSDKDDAIHILAALLLVVVLLAALVGMFGLKVLGFV